MVREVCLWQGLEKKTFEAFSELNMHLSNCMHVKAEKICKQCKKKKGKKAYSFKDKRWQCQTV